MNERYRGYWREAEERGEADKSGSADFEQGAAMLDTKGNQIKYFGHSTMKPGDSL